MADGGSRIAIIGPYDSFMGFVALGVDVVDPAQDERSVTDIIASFSDHEFGIVFISEEHAAPVADEITEMNRVSTQSIIIIPGAQAGTGLATQRIRALVRRAVGADV